jgi:hypothetical protein
VRVRSWNIIRVAWNEWQNMTERWREMEMEMEVEAKHSPSAPE